MGQIGLPKRQCYTLQYAVQPMCREAGAVILTHPIVVTHVSWLRDRCHMQMLMPHVHRDLPLQCEDLILNSMALHGPFFNNNNNVQVCQSILCKLTYTLRGHMVCQCAHRCG